MATEQDVEQIARICSAGYRRAYARLLRAATIEDVIERYYQPERIRSEVPDAPPTWSGYLVTEDEDGAVVATGGGGMTGEAVGEVFVLYVDPDRRGQGFGSAVLGLLTEQQLGRGAREQWVAVQKGNNPGDSLLPRARLRGHGGGRALGRHRGGRGARTLRMRRRLRPGRTARGSSVHGSGIIVA